MITLCSTDSVTRRIKLFSKTGRARELYHGIHGEETYNCKEKEPNNQHYGGSILLYSLRTARELKNFDLM